MFVENLKETIQLGRKFAQGLNPKSIILLQGPIGAGKLHSYKELQMDFVLKKILQAQLLLYRIITIPEQFH